MASVLRIPQEIIGYMVQDAEGNYPREACGVLIGNGAGWVTAARSIPNIAPLNTRYTFDPLVFRDVEHEADASGLEIIAIYHSHPDHPAYPSETDRAHAWPDYVYLILSVTRGKVNDIKAWHIPERGGSPIPVSIQVIEGDRTGHIKVDSH